MTKTPRKTPPAEADPPLFLYHIGGYKYVIEPDASEWLGGDCASTRAVGWLEGAIHLLVTEHQGGYHDLAMMIDPETRQVRRILTLSSNRNCPDPTLTDPLDRLGMYEALIAVQLGLGVAP